MAFGVLCVCVRMFEQACVFPLLVGCVLPTETRTASHRVNRRRLLGLLPVCFDSSKKCSARTTLLSSNLQSRTQAAASLQPGQSSHFLRPPSRVSISRKNMNWPRLLERRPRMAALNFQGTIVNLSWIQEVASLPGGMLNIRLKDTKRTDLTVARDRAREFKMQVGC